MTAASRSLTMAHVTIHCERKDHADCAEWYGPFKLLNADTLETITPRNFHNLRDPFWRGYQWSLDRPWRDFVVVDCCGWPVPAPR